MNDIQRYLARAEQELTKEAAEKKINFGKKDEFFRMLREDATYMQISDFIDTKVGKNFRPWHQEKFKTAYQELQTLRKELFQKFKRKSHLEKYNIPEEDLEALEKSFYQGKEEAIRQLISSRIKSEKSDKITEMAIDWTKGIEIDSDKDEEVQKMSPVNIDKLKSAMAKETEAFCLGEQDLADALTLVLREDWDALKTLIEDFDPDCEQVIANIRSKYTELLAASQPIAQPTIPTYSEKDRAQIREFVVSCMEYLEKDAVDTVVEACCENDEKKIREACETAYGEDEVQDYLRMVVKFLDADFPEVRASQKTSVLAHQKPALKQPEEVHSTPAKTAQEPVKLPPPPPLKELERQLKPEPVEVIKSPAKEEDIEFNYPKPVASPVIRTEQPTQKTEMQQQKTVKPETFVPTFRPKDQSKQPQLKPVLQPPENLIQFPKPTQPTRETSAPAIQPSPELNLELKLKSKPPPPPPSVVQLRPADTLLPSRNNTPSLTSKNEIPPTPSILTRNTEQPTRPQLDEKSPEEAGLEEDIERLLQEINESLVINLRQNIDQPRVEELHTDDLILEFGTIPADINQAFAQVEPSSNDLGISRDLNQQKTNPNTGGLGVSQGLGVSRDLEERPIHGGQCKKFYVMIKYKDVKVQTVGSLSKYLKVRTSTKREYPCNAVGNFDCYALYLANCPVSVDDYIWFEFSVSRDVKIHKSYRIEGKDFPDPTNFMLGLIFETHYEPEIVKMTHVEELCALALMLPTDKDFIELIGFLDGKEHFKKRFFQTAKTFEESKDMYTMFKYHSKRKQIFYVYYLMALIYQEYSKPEDEPFMKEGYIEKTLGDCERFDNNSQCSRELDHVDNIFRLVFLRICLRKKNANGKESALFNRLIGANFNVPHLVRMLYMDNGREEKQRRLTAVDRDKLLESTRRFKSSVLEHLYMMMVVVASIGLSNGCNTLGRYLEVLQTVSEQTADGQLYLSEEMRIHEEKIKTSIQRQSFNACSGKFYMIYPSNDCFVKMITLLTNLNPIYLRCLMNEHLEKVLKQHISTILAVKNEESVDIIRRVFLHGKNMVLDWNYFEEVIKRFFGREFTRKIAGTFSFRQTTQTVFERDYVSEGVLTCFAALVMYPLLLRKDTKQRNFTVESFANSLIFNKRDFMSVVRILSTSLEGQRDWGEFDLKTIFQPYYLYIFQLLERAGMFSQKSLVVSKEWLNILKLKEPLRDFLLDLFSKKFKAWKVSHDAELRRLPDLMADDLLNYQGASEEECTQILFMMTDFNDVDSITIDDLRKVLSECPQRAKQYAHVLMKGSHNVKSRIEGFVRQIKDEIQYDAKIKRSVLTKVVSIKDDTLTHINVLFSADHGADPMSKLLKILDEKCKCFMDQLKRISNLCKAFENEVDCLWDIHQMADDKYTEFSRGQIEPIDFRVKPQLEALRKLDTAVFSFYSTKLFKEKLVLSRDMTVAEFCGALSKGLDFVWTTIVQFLVRFRNNTLTMEDVLTLGKSLTSTEDLKKLLELMDKTGMETASHDQILDLVAIFRYNGEFKYAFTLYNSLKYISDCTKDTLMIDNAVFTRMRTQQFRTVLARDFLQTMQQFELLVQRYELRINDQDNDINRILEITAKSNELGDLIRSLKEGQIEELKEYMNDQDDTNNLNSKNMLEFEHVHRYYMTVLGPATGLGDYLKRLQLFLEEESRSKDSESLASSLDSCMQVQVQLRNILKEAGSREQSFKFKVEKLMDEGVIILKHNEQTGEKDVRVEYGKDEEIPFRNLVEWRDKTLLLINAAKKNKEEVEQDILMKLNSFVRMYEALDDVLTSYKKLTDLGYFVDFVSRQAIVSEKKFFVRHSNFEEIAEHNIDVRKECQVWEEQINEAYSKSFAFAHFQGHDLKQLARGIKNERYVTALREVIPTLTQARFREYMADGDNNFRFRRISSPLHLLEFITSMLGYFERELPQLDRLPSEKRLIDNRIPIRLIALVEQRVYCGMLAPGLEALQKVNMPQILLCRDSTSIYDVRTFLMRAMLDPSRPYFVIGTHYLNAEIQNSFCDTIERALQHEQLKHDIKRINLYMIDNSLNERIYNYFANHKDKLFRVIRSEEIPGEALSYFHRQAGPTKIVASSAAGLGKTFWIEQDIKRLGKKPCYFPVAGNLSFERLHQRIRDLGLTGDNALIIQIHNIKDKKTLDEFLFQVVFFKCIKHEGFLYLPEQLSIYIELQNVLNQKHLDELQVLAILAQGKGIVEHLEAVKAADIRIDPLNRKWMFVLKYLQLLHSKEIDKKQLTYEEFCAECDKGTAGMLLAQGAISELVEHYLFDPLRKANNMPSYIQMVSFLSLMFESLNTFAKSPYYTVEVIKEYSTGDFKGSQLEQYRSKHVELLVSNSRDFLFRTITENNFKDNPTKEEQEAADAFGRRLREFPFCIVPNADENSYSFIYKEAKGVDPLIRKYTALQGRYLKQSEYNNDAFILARFSEHSLNALNSVQLGEEMHRMLKEMAHRNPNTKLKPDENYSLTLDNFFKMCLIVQRMRANIPIIIMGETGVGKTALIDHLVKNVFIDELMQLNIHAGTNEAKLLEFQKQMREQASKIEPGKKLWVFLDEFNTTEEVGYIKEIIMERRFMGRAVPDNIVFLAACNPFRTKQVKANTIKVGIEKKSNPNAISQSMLYKVLPPPESMIEIMWNFQELKEEESRIYIETIIHSHVKVAVPDEKPDSKMEGKENKEDKPVATRAFITYRPKDVARVIHVTHEMFKRDVEKSAVNLRDVSRFKILYCWFMGNMPEKAVNEHERQAFIDYEHNIKLDRGERAFILSICFCYYMRLGTFEKRMEYLSMIEKEMGYSEKHMSKVLENEQLDYLSRMQRPKGCALNLALRENVFTCLVCLMNKLPIIIVGMPGCSKSLAIRLLVSNLRGKNSHDDFFKRLPELQLFPYQGGESCSSEGVLKVFQRAENKNYKKANCIPCILFDEIGLAELSVHNPLKVLHAKLEVNKTEIAFIGISNWELDASKMARFLVINRPIPDEVDLTDTAEKIFQSYDNIQVDGFKPVTESLSKAYFRFIKEWKGRQLNDHPDFFGLRDFYSLIKYVCSRILTDKVSKDDERKCVEIMRRSVERNFDGRPDSIKLFLRILANIFKNDGLVERIDEQVDILDLIAENISDTDKNSRCLLQIVKGEALIYIINQKQVGIDKKANNNIIMLHGSTFEKDWHSAEYNLLVISDIITYVARGDVIVMKDVPNSVQTSLYDLLNKSYQTVGQKNFCRVSVGAHYNPKCFVHPSFNCIVNIMEEKLREVDPPFLNRFEKHYLTFNQFLTFDENRIIGDMEAWIDRLLKEHITKENPLLSEHYIINICRESLASLAIKCLMEWEKEHPEQEIDHAKCLEQAKLTLLLNSTTDFKLLMSVNRPHDDQDAELVDKAFEYKKTFLQEDRLKLTPNLIVYTYDQTAEIFSDNFLYERKNEQGKDCTKIIKVCELKCEKDLRNDLEDFYRQPHYKVCHIKINFEKQHQHLCMIVFLLDSMTKKYERPDKRIVIILVVSRLTLLTNNKRYKQISYLNGFQQVFVENLSRDALDVDAVPAQGAQIIQRMPHLFNFDEIVQKLFSAVVKRFDFTVRFDQQSEIVKDYVELLNQISENAIFRKQCKEYLVGRFRQQNPTIKNWKKEVLLNKEIANLAPTTEAAMRLCLESRFEEDLAIYLNFLIENEVVCCFDGVRSVDILKKCIPITKEVEDELLETVKSANYKSLFEHLLKLQTPGPNKNMRKISKAVGEERREITFPKLFPFAKRERNYMLQKERNNEEEDKQNDIGGDETLEDLCAKIDELDMALEAKRDEEALTNIESKLNQARNFIARKTSLAEFVEAGQEPDYDYLRLMNTEKDWAGLKHLFLMDIFNCFISSSLQADVRDSLELQKVLKLIVADGDPIEQQIITLLRGHSLWKKLVVILRVFREVDLTDQLEQFWLGFHNPQPEQHRECFLTRIAFIRSFTERCNEKLFPNEHNIDELGGFRNYEFLFNNVYYILEGLENEFRGSGVSVPFRLRLMRNFLKTIGMIAADNREHLVNSFLSEKEDNLYLRIHRFIQVVKKETVTVKNDRDEDVVKLRYESKMAVLVRYQASNLFLYWIEDLQNREVHEGAQLELFIGEFVRLVDEEEEFAHYCTNVIRQILKVDLSGTISEICDSLSNAAIANDLALRTLDSDIIKGEYNNSMSVVLVDYFCRNIDEPQPDEDIDGPPFWSFCLHSLYPSFEEILVKLDQEQFNGIQTAAFLGFCRQFLTYYAYCLTLPNDEYERLDGLHQFMNLIDQQLCKNTAICKNLRMFCLKLIRSNEKSLRDVQVKYISINRANWMRDFQDEFKGEATTKQFIVPPKVPEVPEMDRLLKRFDEAGFKDVAVLGEMLKIQGTIARYKLFTMFMTEIYTGLCGPEATQAIRQYLAAQQPNEWLTKYELDLLKRYTQGKVTPNLEYKKQEDISKINNQTWILNNLNWLMSIRKCVSPLTSIFFDANGDIPANFAEHLSKQFLICGNDNPFRSIIESIASATPEVAMYICSNKCDFVYTLQGCGWPSGKSKCRFCDSDISGDGHQLLRYQNEGARRLGPNLLFKGGQFMDPNDYAAANTYHNAFYIWVSNGSLRNLTAYWKSLPFYLRREIDRIIEKPEVVVQEKKIDRDNGNRVITEPVTYRMTGYSKFNVEGLSRIHNYTNHILLVVLNSLVYFFTEFGWINDEECTKAFANRDCNQMREFAYNLMVGEAKKLEELLNHGDWASWLMGMQSIIFGIAGDFKTQYNKAVEEKQRSSVEEVKKIEQAKNAAKDNTHKMLLENIVKDGVLAELPKIEDFSARKCWNRDFFERLVQAEVTRWCSGEDKINFIKANKCMKGEMAYPFDAVLLEENLNRIKDFSFLRVLRLAINPTYKHMTKEYSMRISQQFPILDFLLSNLGKINNIALFWDVVSFVNEITNYVEFAVSREEAKTTKTVDFINRLNVSPEKKTELLKMLGVCCRSWNTLAKMIGVVQYECKVLGAMNDTYKPEEMLIAFLVDSLEANNYYGKMMSGVMHLFAAAHNELIMTIEAKKQTITQMKDVQLFSDNQYLPQKITANDIIRLDTGAIEDYIAASSSSSVKYSNGIPLYNFDLIQYKLTNKLYGKKRLVTDMKHYSNVQFSGESFTRAGKYSNYITEVRQVGANRPLDPNDRDRLRAKLQDIKQKDENNFYNFIKNVQGFIEKIMIFYKNLQDKNVTIGDYIAKYGFRNVPEVMLEFPIKSFQIESVVSLYEEVEGLIVAKIFTILPADYRTDVLTADQRRQFTDLFNKMRATEADRQSDLPTLDEFRTAFYRLAARCLILAEIPNNKMLMEFLPARLDFWPYMMDDAKREMLPTHLGTDIQLSKVFDLYEMIENIGKPQVKEAIKPVVQGEKIDIKGGRRRPGKKEIVRD